MLDPPDGPYGCEEAAGEDDAGKDEDGFFPGGDGRRRGIVHSGAVLSNVAIEQDSCAESIPR